MNEDNGLCSAGIFSRTGRHNDDCPDGQMMILPCGKNDDASFGRNDEMNSASVPEALITDRASGTRHSPGLFARLLTLFG
ncbi:MAG: hypothetical protein J6330_11915 [Clostridia bacterium]|nr:hypothetical protein [Clostridia bacterium]